MIKEFQYQPNEINIETSEIEELMGYESGLSPEPVPELIDNALKEFHLCSGLQGGFRIFDSILTDIANHSIHLNNQTFYPGKIVITQLKKSSSAALFVCTAGSAISNHARQISLNGDPLLGYIFDVIGSILVEKVADKIQDELKKEIEKGMNLSDRFSPGYCDWSVSEQQKLFALFPNNFCSITLSETSLMNPIKSVSGIIGIGAENKQLGYQCNWCSDLNCIYGKVKRKKSNKKI